MTAGVLLGAAIWLLLFLAAGWVDLKFVVWTVAGIVVVLAALSLYSVLWASGEGEK